jgi:heme/copper-type cytochrome/quinol oxidase subunit 3
MELPYNVERRPDTGVNNVTLGIWLFLASEVMLFGGLFSAYVLLRGGSPDWPAGSAVSSVAIGGLNTALLLASSVVIALARRAAAEGNESRARMLLAVIAATGVVFLGIKGFEYWTKLEHGLYPSTSTFLAVYFLLTSVHALHVLGGVMAVAHFALSGTCATAGSLPRFANRVGAAALYWYFVDIVWIGIFILLYVL